MSTGFISLWVGTKEMGSYDSNNARSILKQIGEFLD